MIIRSNDFARSRRPTHPAVKLALIVTAASAVYACDYAASPTEPDSGTWGRILPIVDVTPGVTTVCPATVISSFVQVKGSFGSSLARVALAASLAFRRKWLDVIHSPVPAWRFAY